MTDEYYMKRALELAHKAFDLGEVPVGALIVKDGEIISEAYNLREKSKMSTAHAEILAIEEACRRLGSWRLEDCTLYVTLEPCPMCAGALINSRIGRVVYGVKDPRAGCLGSLLNFNSYPFNHNFTVDNGILKNECAQILNDFFMSRREKK